jgi:hypothetical protein
MSTADCPDIENVEKRFFFSMRSRFYTVSKLGICAAGPPADSQAVSPGRKVHARDGQQGLAVTKHE